MASDKREGDRTPPPQATINPNDAPNDGRLCTLTLLLADAGGRGMGGLPLGLTSDGPLFPGAFRVGHPIPLRPGGYHVTLPLTPPQTLHVDLKPGEERRLDLGRLGALIPRVRRGMDHLYVGAPLTLVGPAGEEVPGRLDDEMLLWPGSYTLKLDLPGGKHLSRQVEVEAGRLLELELGEGPGARRLRDLAGEFSGAAKTLLRRSGLGGGDVDGRRGKAAPLTLITAAGRPMGGPCLGDDGEFWLQDLTHDDLAGVTGALRCPGVGGQGPSLADAKAQREIRLASVEVHLKDPEALSLRGAPLQLRPASGGEAILGELGRLVNVWPGTYTLSLPTLPGFERVVEVPGGSPTQVDLGLAHQITLASGDRAFGTPIEIWREDAPEGTAPLAQSALGVECLLPNGRYRVSIEGDAPEVMASKRRRKVWPKVKAQFLGADGDQVGPSGPA